MKLNRGEIRPGKIVQIVDVYGTVRAEVYGLFTEYDKVEDLPVIKPLFTLSRNAYTQPKVDDKIYVLFSADDPRLLFYFFMCDYQNQLSEILDNNGDYKPIDVIFKSDNDGNVAQIIYNTTDGNELLIQNGDSFIKMTDETIEIFNSADSTKIDMSDDSITIGKDSGEQPMLLGDDSAKLIKDIITQISNLYTTLGQMLPIISGSASPASVFGLSGTTTFSSKFLNGITECGKLKMEVEKIKSKTNFLT